MTAQITIYLPIDCDPCEYERRVFGMVLHTESTDCVKIGGVFAVNSTLIVRTDRPVGVVVDEIIEAIGEHGMRVEFI